MPQARAADETRHNTWTQPHVLRLGDISEVTSLNPMFSAQLVLSRLSSMTMAYLVKYDHDNRPIPELVNAVPAKANGGISADGKTITFHLRKGVKWSDGVPFDADDVVFTTNLVLDPKTLIISRDGWDLITKIDEPDKYTVVFHLKQAYSSFLPTFYGSAGANPCVLPKHLLEHTANINTDPYNSKPVGIGPFRFVEWRRGDRVIMEANPYYFRGLPKLKRVEYHIIPNRDTVLLQLQTGEIDMWPDAARAYYLRLKALSGITVTRQPSYGYGHIDFNVTQPIVRDPAVRHALALAIDRETLKDKVARGIGIIQDGVWSPASPFFDAKIKTTAFDLAKANAILEGAGWKRNGDFREKNGEKLAVAFVSNSGSPDTDLQIELIRGWWKQIGVDLQRKDYDPAMLFAQPENGGILYSGKFDVALFAWYPTPSGDLSAIYGCKNVSPHGQNVLRWCDRKAEEAMEAFRLTYDLSQQKVFDGIVQERLVAEVPTYVLQINEDLFGYNSDLKGFAPNAVSQFDDMMNVDI
ncbi:MAG TPA: peptide ABC transporter substrate-binding protein [Candidatus Baltobacteraceae bacterium]|nr:peptide ABC transporter substrate-binding protein [Candidatus Baltobacteraceae bacterium]